MYICKPSIVTYSCWRKQNYRLYVHYLFHAACRIPAVQWFIAALVSKLRYILGIY